MKTKHVNYIQKIRNTGKIYTTGRNKIKEYVRELRYIQLKDRHKNA